MRFALLTAIFAFFIVGVLGLPVTSDSSINARNVNEPRGDDEYIQVRKEAAANWGADWKRKEAFGPADWRRKETFGPADWKRKEAFVPADWKRKETLVPADWKRLESADEGISAREEAKRSDDDATH